MDGGAGQVTGRAGTQARDSYRVEYLAAEGDGHIVVRASDPEVGIVDHAAALLRERGVDDPRIRRVVPLAPRPGRSASVAEPGSFGVRRVSLG